MSETATEAVVSAACLELYSGYGWDGDDHWGAGTHPGWGSNGSAQYQAHYHDAAQGHLDFVAYIDDGLQAYLRGYTFSLDQRRPPRRRCQP
ncbi:hypothetical protein ACFZDK_10925 [Streptomyces sp. NPDC007901]|uniref:hypothetical protein n=1 Tax=Streptomyces sp. NPDC007901 TaxID=3364785 RepID=UPI0036EB2FFB